MNPDIQLWANWIHKNLTEKNKALAAELAEGNPAVQRILSKSLAKAIVFDRAGSLNKAVDSGECKAQGYLTPKGKNLEEVSGALADLLLADLN